MRNGMPARTTTFRRAEAMASWSIEDSLRVEGATFPFAGEVDELCPEIESAANRFEESRWSGRQTEHAIPALGGPTEKS